MPAKRGPGIRKSGTVFGHAQETAKTIRAGLYARVSTQDQQTLPMQNRTMREYAVRRGWTIAMQVLIFCESANGFCNDVGYQDEGFFDALVNMFEQAIKITCQLSAGDRDTLIVRLDRVLTISHKLAYGVGDDMDSLLANNIETRPPFGRWFTCFASLAESSRCIGRRTPRIELREDVTIGLTCISGLLPRVTQF